MLRDTLWELTHHIRFKYIFCCLCREVPLLVSGVLPIYQSCHEYVTAQRLEHFNELKKVVKVMRIVSEDKLEQEVIYTYVAMYLIEQQTYMLNLEQIFNLKEAAVCFDITNAVCRMNFNSCDTYWISKAFTNLVRQKIHPKIPNLVSESKTCCSFI